MRIVRLDVIPVTIPLRVPVRLATHAITDAANVLVRMESDDGVVGWGEAAEAHNMTGDLQPGIVEAARRLGEGYLGRDPRRLRALARAADSAIYGNTSAKAALDIAAHDVVARALQVPVHQLLGGAVRDDLDAQFMVTGGDPDAAERTAQARAEGYRQFKVKVGVSDVESDAQTIAAVREAAGPDAVIGADANQSLSVDGAIRLATAAAPSLDYLEQPLRGVDPAGLLAIRRGVHVNLGVDEGLHGLDDIRRYAEAGAVDGVALKLIKLGGIGRMMTALELCDLLGLAVNLSGKIAETSIASAALAHVAAAAPDVGWGVSITNNLLADDSVVKALEVAGGSIALPDAPGLGVEVDEEAVERWRAGDSAVLRL